MQYFVTFTALSALPVLPLFASLPSLCDNQLKWAEHKAFKPLISHYHRSRHMSNPPRANR